MGDIDKDTRQIELIDYIEDAEKAGPPLLDRTFSDEELDRGGLVPVKAFVRSKTSKNAERVRKAAERREKGENGPARKQINLQAPVDDDARKLLQEINSSLLDGSATPDVIRRAMSNDNTDWKQRALTAERELDELRNRIESMTKRPRRWFKLFRR
jgi:hypothetical protein